MKARSVPWWAVSIGIHSTLVIISLFIIIAFVKRDEEIVSLTPPREAPFEEIKPKTMEIQSRELDLERAVEDPAIYKAPEADSVETPCDEEFQKAVGECLDAISDKPFRGKAVYDSIGVAGGGGGKYGARFGGRRLAVARGGGCKETEDAVLNALRWLARHQSSDGSWATKGHSRQCGKVHGFSGVCSPCPGDDGYQVGTTGLALLAFLGAGYTHLSKDAYDGISFGDIVKNGLQYLMKNQQPNGRLTPEESPKYMYNQMLGSFALNEAYGLTSSMLLRDAAQKATDYVVQAQNPGKAWRYSYRSGDNDSSVTGWGVQALKSAELAELSFPRDSMKGALAWFDEVTDSYGRAGYLDARDGKVVIPGVNERYADHPALTAIQMMSRSFITRSRAHPAIRGGANQLSADLPEWDSADLKADMYYWYYGSMAMFQLDGPSGPQWKRWNEKVKSAVLDKQNRTRGDCRHGSWEPVDRWSSEGGRVYMTATGALTNEVYYRYPNVLREKKGQIEEELVVIAGEFVSSDAITQGTLRSASGDVPLEHTNVHAKVSGFLASTEVEQRYVNSTDQPIEATYFFPLPTLAAVNGFTMEIGNRKIVGVIRPVQEAKAIYDQAVRRGQTASLLTQEAASVFRQKVGNIPAKSDVTIRITYFETLKYDAGFYEWVFPMVVMTRYGEGPLAGPHTGHVPLQRTGHDISLSIDLNAGLPITAFEAVTHDVKVHKPGPTRWTIELSRNDSIPNRDFVARWSVAGAETKFGTIAHNGPAGGFFTLLAQAPIEKKQREAVQKLREITFIVDISGSMHGWPLDACKGVIRGTLDRLGDDDLVNVVVFAGGNGQLWDLPKPATKENKDEVKNYVETLRAGGGTEMLAGLRRAMAASHDPRRIQMYVFMTDGLISEEQGIMQILKSERGGAHFFAFGPGQSVNRGLLDAIGELGHGATIYPNPSDPHAVPSAVDRLFGIIAMPWLEDVSIDWNGLPVFDLYPSELPTLFAGQTLALSGRYKEPADGTIYVCGRVGQERVRYPIKVTLPKAEPENDVLASIWARRCVHELQTRHLTAEAWQKEVIEDMIVRLACDFQLVTRYTAFVAVDEARADRRTRVFRVDRAPVDAKAAFAPQVIVEGWEVTLEADKDKNVRVVRGSSLPAGARIVSVDGTPVSGLGHLESLLIQAQGRTVNIGVSTGRSYTLPKP